MPANRVLITGAGGMIGRCTVPLLQARGFEVHAVVHAHGCDAPSSQAVTHCVDLLDDVAASHILDQVKPTHLLHMAWITRPDRYMTDPENARWLQSGLALAQGALRRGCRRIVAAGSCAEYDWSHSPCREDSTPLSESTPYAAAKNGLRRGIEALSAETGLSWAWGRIFHQYGPHEHPKRFVPYVIRSALGNEPIRCSHGRQLRDFSYSADLAAAFVALLDSDVQGPINLGSGSSIQLRDIVETVLAAVPSHSAGVHYGAVASSVSDPLELIPDLTRLQRELGWKPDVDLASGLKATIEWWQHADATHA